MPGETSPGAVALVWELPGAGGPQGSGLVALAGTDDQSTRYDAWDYDRLLNFGGDPWGGGLTGAISSVSLFAPAAGATVLILFNADGPGPVYNASHFDRHFLVLDNRTGGRVDVDLSTISFEAGSWDNCATSMIVVHTAQSSEVRISAASTLTPVWNSFVDPQLASAAGDLVTSITRKGDPKWSWTAFPVDRQFLSPSGNYLRVHQELAVSLSNPWPDYSASITYYLRLAAANGTVTGFVKRWEYWAEDGLLTDFVAAVLRPYTMLGAARLNGLIAGGGLVPAGIQVNRLYYLPGNQTDATKKGEFQIFKGFSGDDATIVLS